MYGCECGGLVFDRIDRNIDYVKHDGAEIVQRIRILFYVVKLFIMTTRSFAPLTTVATAASKPTPSSSSVTI
jgi:hypothetical protein